MTSKQHTKQKTIGLLGTDITLLPTDIQNQIWQGAISMAQQYNARLVFYPAVRAYHLERADARSNVLFDFIDADYLDGLLIWSGGILETLGKEGEERLLECAGSIPLVTIAGGLKGHPDISVDNYQGMRMAVEHLIEIHGSQRIAFVRGPLHHPEAEQRYQAYADALQAHGIQLDPAYVAQGAFQNETGFSLTEAAVSQWLRDSDIRLEAVVTASDYMAKGALKAVQDHGLQVPDDIAVVGFDDVVDAQASIPSLTTVRQPFYELGRQATKMLFDLFDGKSLPLRSSLPSQLIVRESCGCISGSMMLADDYSEVIRTDQAPPPDDFSKELEAVAQELGIVLDQLEELDRLLMGDLSAQTPDQFLPRLRLLLAENLETHFNSLAWQNVISVLRNHALSISDGNIGAQGETIFNQARVLVAEMAERARITERLEINDLMEELRDSSEALNVSLEQQMLLDTLSEKLPVLGFSSFYLSLYQGPDASEPSARLVLAYENNQPVELPPEGIDFPSYQLVPESLSSLHQTDSLIIEPLTFGDEPLGILVLQVDPAQAMVCETLRMQVSSALQGVQLFQEIQKHASQLERRVANQTAELTQAVEQLQAEIAERKQIQQDLLLTQFSVEQASIGIMQTGSESQILRVNQHYCELSGYSHEELCNMHIYDLDPDYPLERWKEHRAYIRKHGSDVFETIHRRKDGTIMPVEITTAFIAFEGAEYSFTFIRDITERKQMLEALRLKSFAIEQVSDAVYWINRDAIITDGNEAACKMFGYPREEFIGLSVAEIDPTLPLDGTKALWRKIKEEGSLAFESQHKTKDGRVFPVEIVVSHISHEGRELNCAFARDITERKQAEEEVRLNNFALERTSDAVHWVNSEARIVDVNEAACRMLGYSREELLGMFLGNIDLELDWTDLPAIWEVVKAGPPLHETVHRAKDGRLIPVEVMGNFIEFEGKELNCAFVRDITDRKRAEKALRLNSFALEHISDAVQWVNSEGQIVDVNEAACRMLGYSREEYHNMPLDRIDTVLPEPEIVKMWGKIKQEGTQTFETQHKTKDGRLIPVEIMANFIEFEGQELNCCFIRDITERKRTEEALRLNSFALERSSDAVYWAKVATIIDVNEAACRMLGYTHEEFQGMPITTIDPLLPEPEIVKIWEQVKKEGTQTFETQHKTKDGQVIPVEIMVNYHEFEGKELNCCFVRDITERKQAEEALRLNNFALERTSDAVQWINLTTIVDVNEAACRMLGYSREEFRGMSVTNIDPAMSEADMVKAWERVKKEGAITLETQHKSKDGRIIPVEVMANYIAFEGKELNCCFVRDITERKQAEEALRQSEARYRALIESQIDLISRYRPDTILTFVNDAYCQFYGKTREELIGNTFMFMIAPEFREMVRLETESLVTNPRLLSGEYLNLAADGRERWLQWVIKPIAGEDGQVIEMQAVGRDVTEIKQAEEKIRQLNEELEQRVLERTKELEEANEEIRHFAYIVSHDLRAPLVNLKGFASELRLNLKDVMDGFGELLPSVEPTKQDRMRLALQEDIPEALRFIESSVSNMDTFTKAILKLSRLGRLHLELVEVDVKELVEKTLDSLAYQIEKQGIKVTVGDLPVITADLVSVEQIFGNILTNAVIYCDPVRPGKIEVSAEQRPADTLFRIQDNGRGIAKEDMDKVFAPFRRAGEQDVPGEGMGLAYVQTLVRRHGGRIWCESESGVGTTFTFTIAKGLREDNIMP